MTDPIWPEKFDPRAWARHLKGDLTPQEWQKLYLQEPAPPLIDPNDPDYRWDDRTGRWVRRRNR
jgi:hypothetical protein